MPYLWDWFLAAGAGRVAGVRRSLPPPPPPSPGPLLSAIAPLLANPPAIGQPGPILPGRRHLNGGAGWVLEWVAGWVDEWVSGLCSTHES